MDHWTGALLLERSLIVLASGFNAAHFLRELWRLRRLEGGGLRRGRAMRAAVVAMVVINASLVVGALYPLAASRFEAVGRQSGAGGRRSGGVADGGVVHDGAGDARKEVREQMGTLARAIEAENWELAAYVLAISVLRVAEAVPPETLSALLELLEGSDGTGA